MRTILAATLKLALASLPAFAQDPGGGYGDAATSQWFRDLSSAYTHNCCDQADCRRVRSDYHDGAWWALSARTGTWVRIAPDQITSVVSVFPDAVLCEGEPLVSYGPDGAPAATGAPRVFCFAPPPLGF